MGISNEEKPACPYCEAEGPPATDNTKPGEHLLCANCKKGYYVFTITLYPEGWPKEYDSVTEEEFRELSAWMG